MKKNEMTRRQVLEDEDLPYTFDGGEVCVITVEMDRLCVELVTRCS